MTAPDWDQTDHEDITADTAVGTTPDRKRVTIHTGPGPFEHQVLLGETDISGMVMGVDIAVRPGHPPTVTLALRDVHALARADQVRLTQETAAVLIELGWTPPVLEARPETSQGAQG